MGKSPINVLVVEDEPLVRALLTSLLEADGFQIKSASNAAEARTATKDFEPQVAILDALRRLAMGKATTRSQLKEGLRFVPLNSW